MNGASMIVLLVEDSPAHAEAIRRAFEDADVAADIQIAATLGEYRARVAAVAPTRRRWRWWCATAG